ncbi:MAG: cupin domain-containing protein [Planctomycetaceae bacterium]|nr:cupin domain-containing protein [Planctomycetaceae bacterium]
MANAGVRYYRTFDETSLQDRPGHASCVMLDASNGCTGECLAGISIYHDESFPEAQTHPFQEGFYVIEGRGEAMVGSERFPIAAGTSFLVPAGTAHALCSRGGAAVKVFWFHSE